MIDGGLAEAATCPAVVLLPLQLSWLCCPGAACVIGAKEASPGNAAGVCDGATGTHRREAAAASWSRAEG